MEEINNESPFDAIQRIINKYPPMDVNLCEEIMRRYRNGEDVEKFISETKGDKNE